MAQAATAVRESRPSYVKTFADVSGGGAGADEQGIGDLPVGAARRHQPQHLQLPRRVGRGPPAVRAAVAGAAAAARRAAACASATASASGNARPAAHAAAKASSPSARGRPPGRARSRPLECQGREWRPVAKRSAAPRSRAARAGCPAAAGRGRRAPEGKRPTRRWPEFPPQVEGPPKAASRAPRRRPGRGATRPGCSATVATEWSRRARQRARRSPRAATGPARGRPRPADHPRSVARTRDPRPVAAAPATRQRLL